MLTTRELLAAVKAAQAIPSNYALARVLGVPENTVANWHTGRNLPSDEWSAKLAALARLDPDHVVACVHAERAQNDDVRALWTRIAKRLQATAAAALTAIVSVWIALAPSGEAQAAARGYAAPVPCEQHLVRDIHCRVLRALRRLRRWLARARHDMCGRPLVVPLLGVRPEPGAVA
jgi:hypothetical protein